MDSIQLYAVRMIDLEHDTFGRVELHPVIVLRRPQSARVIREYSTTDAQYTPIRRVFEDTLDILLSEGGVLHALM